MSQKKKSLEVKENVEHKFYILKFITYNKEDNEQLK